MEDGEDGFDINLNHSMPPTDCSWCGEPVEYGEGRLVKSGPVHEDCYWKMIVDRGRKTYGR